MAQPTDLQPQVVGLCEQFPLPFSDVLEAGPRYEYGVLAKSLQDERLAVVQLYPDRADVEFDD